MPGISLLTYLLTYLLKDSMPGDWQLQSAHAPTPSVDILRSLPCATVCRVRTQDAAVSRIRFSDCSATSCDHDAAATARPYDRTRRLRLGLELELGRRRRLGSARRDDVTSGAACARLLAAAEEETDSVKTNP